ncbi:MAG TPA: ATP-binding cassette domain-containing protein [Sphaerochaeta sp.]|nr:ATP-binding cassette domain-containing protein [Sphaerochaeta sp.]HQB05194.1 ATP-binding cassette domain-containing protein [Sphaerochaeta sp.]
MEKQLLHVENLRKEFVVNKTLMGKSLTILKAVDGVSFDIGKSEILGLVGESGCGKTTLGRMIVQLTEPTDGKIIFDGEDITHVRSSRMRNFRKDIQFIFQDPYASLNPRKTIVQAVRAPLDAFNEGTIPERNERVAAMLEQVGLSKEFLKKYPYEMSGGQRQRVAIARAMILRPKLIICDEPVSGLDVSVRAQVLNLMKTLQQNTGVSYLFISHDLSVTHHLCNRIAIMYLGKIVELADKEDFFRNPIHPYTKALLSSIPLADRDHKRNRDSIEGDVPSPLNPPSGCRFHTRCVSASEICSCEVPELIEILPRHYVACHLAESFKGGNN